MYLMNPLLPTLMSIFCHFFIAWRTFSFVFQLISINTQNRISSNQSKYRKISVFTKIGIVEFLQTPDIKRLFLLVLSRTFEL